MSKPKNRIFCYEANRQKIVFETEKKALMFIKYNGSDIEQERGYKPIRAYYCQCCDGWHVTSHEDRKVKGRSITDKVVEAYYKDKENKKNKQIDVLLKNLNQ